MFCQETCANGNQTFSEYMKFGMLPHKKAPESFLSGANNGVWVEV
jgi:hypothetical protein